MQIRHTGWLIEEAIRKEQEQEAFERAEEERARRHATINGSWRSR